MTGTWNDNHDWSPSCFCTQCRAKDWQALCNEGTPLNERPESGIPLDMPVDPAVIARQEARRQWLSSPEGQVAKAEYLKNRQMGPRPH